MSEAAHIDAIVAFFETLTAQTVARCGDIYAPDARFKDPFNEVQGQAEIERIYRHMFEALQAPRFVVHERIGSGSQYFLTWDFHFRFKSFSPAVTQTVRGGSHLQLDTQGRITLHRDYWDAAEELYEKLPAIGSLMRWLKHKASTG
ncbi:nuclear transport factor 2 family protein [Rhodoferax sp.]|uniref:nuclear transport factor 2 family protein n=1 Tax=Rhodoferax sp. TaxID=50421 RepID=UPI00374C9F34